MTFTLREQKCPNCGTRMHWVANILRCYKCGTILEVYGGLKERIVGDDQRRLI